MNSSDTNPTPKLMSVKASAEYLDISRAKFYQIIGEFQTVRIGGRHLVVRESIDRYIDGLIAKEAA